MHYMAWDIAGFAGKEWVCRQSVRVGAVNKLGPRGTYVPGYLFHEGRPGFFPL
jgi:hypothetical protein